MQARPRLGTLGAKRPALDLTIVRHGVGEFVAKLRAVLRHARYARA